MTWRRHVSLSTGPPRARRSLAACLLFVLGLSLAGAAVHADSYDERRVRTGARLFRSLLAADVALPAKVGSDGALHVLVYGRDAKRTAETAQLIAPAGAGGERVRDLPLVVAISDRLPSGDGARPAGVFLAEAPADAELDRLIRWSIDQRVIVYSPFEGHVERGVLGGLAIEAKVQPYLNQRTLEATGLELRPFYLKVAKVHR
jgi:hypothetical protein